ncbi:MAG: TIGR04282 family arsenosugar biosynthesis glycosyltransferase [Sciscionella sp.]
MRACVLVMAKAPVPGFAKTRLCPPATPQQSAQIAAASLLDTVDAALSVVDTRCVVAVTGDLSRAARRSEIEARLAMATVVEQRGADFAARLTAAHADASALCGGVPVLQIGMDTPQVTAELLNAGLDTLRRDGVDAVLAPATDGGWWAMGLTDPAHAEVLRGVEMSRKTTGSDTLAALRALGIVVYPLPELSDVDTMADAVSVAASVPRGAFAAVVAGVTEDRRGDTGELECG